MKITILLLCIIIVVLSVILASYVRKKSVPVPGSNASNNNINSIKKFILEKENATLDRWDNGDPFGFIENSSENVTYFDSGLEVQIQNRKEFKDYLSEIAGKIHNPPREIIKPIVRIYGNIVILTYTYYLKSIPSRWHATEIYQQFGNDWKLIHSHWSESNKN